MLRESFANPKRLGGSLTLQSPGDDILVQVIHVVRHDEVLRCSSAAHEVGVQVEGRGQGRQAWVIDDGKTCEQLNLLPAIQPLPQGCSHLAKGLSVKEEVIYTPRLQ